MRISVQELMPGYLPDKETKEYTKEELSLFRFAYKLLGNMLKEGRVEVIFEDTTERPPSNLDSETIAKPKFKLIQSSGTKEQKDACLYGASPAFKNSPLSYYH
jgi:hypothetical protein